MEFSTDEIDEFKRVFEIVAPESACGITIKDLDVVMRALGKSATEKELQSMINEVDSEGNGFIDFPQFMKSMILRMSGEPEEEELREAFRVFDKDNSGFIGVSHVIVVMMDLNANIGEDDAEEMIRNHDTDGDGKLNYEEFVQMMTTK